MFANMIVPMTSSFEQLPQSAALLAVSSLWQGCLLAACVALCLRLAPRTSANVRFAIWSATFLVAAGLPAWTLLASAPAQPSAPSLSSALAVAHLAHPLLHLDFRWSLAILALWAIASLYRAVSLVLHAMRLRKLWMSATPVAVEPTALPYGLRGKAQVCSSHDLDRPCVIGFLAPRILIPDWLLSTLAPEEIEQILLHEAAHLQRRDDWTNLLLKLTLVLFPLNPALLWIERRLCAEREIACDERVVQATHAPRAYATCLARLAEKNLTRRQQALSLGAWQRRPELVARVHRILAQRKSLAPEAAWLLASILVIAILFCATEMACVPQFVEFLPPSSPSAVSPTEAAANMPSSALSAIAAHRSPAGAPTLPSTHTDLAKANSTRTQSRLAESRPTLSTSPSRPQDSLPAFTALPVLQTETAALNDWQADPVPNRESEWILMTTWQQNDDGSTGPHPPAAVKLMLRVYNSNSHTYAVPTRNGWLLIQL